MVRRKGLESIWGWQSSSSGKTLEYQVQGLPRKGKKYLNVYHKKQKPKQAPQEITGI
jgi:hypothetical protein